MEIAAEILAELVAELEARAEIRQPEELKVLNILKLSVEVLTKILAAEVLVKLTSRMELI